MGEGWGLERESVCLRVSVMVVQWKDMDYCVSRFHTRMCRWLDTVNACHWDVDEVDACTAHTHTGRRRE